MNRRPWVSSMLLAAVCSCLVSAPVVRAQGPDSLPSYSTPPVSMGQPPKWRTAVGIETGYAFKNDKAGWRLFGNATPRGKFPHLGIDLMSLELGGGHGNDEWFGDIGYFVRFPYVRVGVDFRVPDDSFS